MSVIISLHAVERYCDRIDTTASFSEARERIQSAMARSSRLKERTNSGDAQYDAGDMRLVVAEERGKLTVLTILDPSMVAVGSGSSANDGVPEMARELAEQYDKSAYSLTDSELSRKYKEKDRKRLEELEALRTALAAANKRIQSAEQGQGHQTRQLSDQLASANRKLQKQIAHAKRMEDDRERLREILKAVLRELIYHRDVDKAIDAARRATASLVEYLERGERAE